MVCAVIGSYQAQWCPCVMAVTLNGTVMAGQSCLSALWSETTTWPLLQLHLLCITNERWQAPQLIQHSWPMWPRCWERAGQCVGPTSACRADPPGLACSVASTVDWHHSETVNSHAPPANERRIQLSLAAFLLLFFFLKGFVKEKPVIALGLSEVGLPSVSNESPLLSRQGARSLPP